MATQETIANAKGSISTLTGYAQGLSSLYKKFDGIFNKDNRPASYTRDIITHAFGMSGSDVYSPQFFPRAFDEPTYLTFRIEFAFDNERPNVLKDTNSLYYGTSYDYMPEPFLQTNDDATYDFYSAERYLLENERDPGRAALLKQFKAALYDIQEIYPYYITDISGINNLASVNHGSGIRNKDTKIELSFYEALDLRITQILQMYRKIVWSDKYQRWVLPDMMRYFNMKIYVSEVRMFHEVRGTFAQKKPVLFDFSQDRGSAILPNKNAWSLKKVAGITSTVNAVSAQLLGTNNVVTQVSEGLNDLTTLAGDYYNVVANTYIKMCNNVLNEVMPTICFDCHMCEFDIADTFSHISSLSSTNSKEQLKPKISIKVGKVMEYQMYPLNVNLAQKSDGSGYDYSESVYIDDELMNQNVVIDKADTSMEEISEQYLLNEQSAMRSTDILKHRHSSNQSNNPWKKSIQNPTKITDDAEEMAYTRDRLNSLQDGVVTTTMSTASMVASFVNGGNNFDSNSYATSPNGELRQSVSNGKTLMQESNPTAFNTLSTATNPTAEQKQEIISTAAAIKEVANNIYGNKDILSMAVSDEAKESLADNLYSKVIDELEKRSKSDIQKKMLKSANILKK